MMIHVIIAFTFQYSLPTHMVPTSVFPFWCTPRGWWGRDEYFSGCLV